MRTIVLSLMLWLGLIVQPAAAEDIPFAVGQVWALSDADDYLVIIDKLETGSHDQPIAHVTLVTVPNLIAGRIEEAHFGHIMFTQEALRRSVSELVETRDGPYPGYEAEHLWKGDGDGVYTITVAECLTLLLPKVHPSEWYQRPA